MRRSTARQGRSFRAPSHAARGLAPAAAPAARPRAAMRAPSAAPCAYARRRARALARLRQNLARRNLHPAEHDGGSGPGAWAARLAGPKEIKEIESGMSETEIFTLRSMMETRGRVHGPRGLQAPRNNHGTVDVKSRQYYHTK